MKRAGSAFTLVCVLALAFAGAAQAAAGPSDFEMRAPANASASLAGPYKSRARRPPRRFALVGRGWRGGRRPRISLRARKAEGPGTNGPRFPADSDDSPDTGSAERTAGG